jgi:dTDP-4-dehydrorhamnose 3,5-epimerase-like enzyme
VNTEFPEVLPLNLPIYKDHRGSLIPVSFLEHLGFSPARSFILTAEADGAVRGNHAHKQCIQAIQCLAGKIKLTIDNGRSQVTKILDDPSEILIIPKLTWLTLEFESRDTIAYVYASDLYDPKDYLHDYDEFLSLITSSLESK